jgi:hypothetical protein
MTLKILIEDDLDFNDTIIEIRGLVSLFISFIGHKTSVGFHDLIPSGYKSELIRLKSCPLDLLMEGGRCQGASSWAVLRLIEISLIENIPLVK